MNGFLCLNKPIGPTSFDMIRCIRKIIPTKSIGHLGTLDPAASGLLLLAFGKATRVLEYILQEPKTYDFSLIFGSTTDTLDSAGSIVDQHKPIPTAMQVENAIREMKGTYHQEVPHFSAVKIQGTRAYSLARQQKKVSMPSKKVTIHSLVLHEYNERTAEAKLTAVCSKGTYIRALARDIAISVQTIGYASAIHRTAIGPHTLHTSYSPEQLKTHSSPHLCITPLADFLTHLPSYTATQNESLKIVTGQSITIEDFKDSPLVTIHNTDNTLIAIAHKIEGGCALFHPKKVFSTP